MNEHLDYPPEYDERVPETVEEMAQWLRSELQRSNNDVVLYREEILDFIGMVAGEELDDFDLPVEDDDFDLDREAVWEI